MSKPMELIDAIEGFALADPIEQTEWRTSPVPGRWKVILIASIPLVACSCDYGVHSPVGRLALESGPCALNGSCALVLTFCSCPVVHTSPPALGPQAL